MIKDGTCPSCGNALSPSSRFCRECGRDILSGHSSSRLPSIIGATSQFIHIMSSNPPLIQRNRWLPMLALAALALVLVASAIFSYQYFTRPQHPTERPVQISPPTPTPTPTATPIPMVNVTIKLIAIHCKTKESIGFSHDHFYTVWAFTASGQNLTAPPANTQAGLSKPVEVDNGEDIPQNLIMFQGQVPEQGEIEGGFASYNDEQSLPWQTSYPSWQNDVSQAVINGLAGQNFNTITTGTTLDLAVNKWYDDANFNQGNPHQLGRKEMTVLASDSTSPAEYELFKHTVNLIDNWDYTVTYQITLSPVS
jgi:hypothetical protein